MTFANKSVLWDKIYAGWMGKNIGGTLGAPLEGNMTLTDITGYTQEFLEPVENDDLDLQLVALHCAEQYGGQVTSALLSQEWASHVHFQFDEYGHSLTNMRKGLTTPLSGCYNNFFTDCMGAPIRSEIWAMLANGNPKLAAYLAHQDACVDHAGGEGMYGEIFYAVLECLALMGNTNLTDMTVKALDFIPADCATRRCVEHMLDALASGLGWQEIRESILNRFGTPNFTYAPPNIAFSLLGLFAGKGFTQQLLITACCGYDTDCTCATAASILGLMYGIAYIDHAWIEPLGENIIVSRPITGIRPPRTIAELTERTIAAISPVHQVYADRLVPEIKYAQYRQAYLIPQGSAFLPDYACEITYQDNNPACAPCTKKNVSFKITNCVPHTVALKIELHAPNDFVCLNESSGLFTLEEDCSKEISFTVLPPKEKAGFYPAEFIISTYYNGLLWKTDRLSFSLLPSFDWKLRAGEKVSTVYSPDSSIALPYGYGSLELSTYLHVESDCIKRLKACVSCPVALYVDGELAMKNEHTTDVIPAYHRPSEKEWTGSLRKGNHEIKLLLTSAEQVDRLYFYAVTPEQTYYAADILCTQNLEPQAGKAT